MYLLFVSLFLISSALTAGSIMITSALRKKYSHAFIPSILYMQVFYFMFGFYSLWGQLILAYFINPLVNIDLQNKILEIILLLGTPFIIFSWYMLIRSMNEMIGNPVTSLFTFLFLLVNLALLPVSAYMLSTNVNWGLSDLVRYSYIFFNALYISWSCILLLVKRNNSGILNPADFKSLAYLLLVFLIAETLVLLFYSGSIWLALIFLLLFFLKGASYSVFYKYYASIQLKNTTVETLPESFEAFCAFYEISQREKEIIKEICNGLTNQQIADKLFISLQTVKDHTHRIYSKTDVSNRSQLIVKVRVMNG